jgi:hypothetical protein
MIWGIFVGNGMLQYTFEEFVPPAPDNNLHTEDDDPLTTEDGDFLTTET